MSYAGSQRRQSRPSYPTFSMSKNHAAVMGAARSRAEGQPVPWEIPAGCVSAFLLLSLLILPVGQGAATWVEAGTFVLPHGSAPLLQSIGGLVTGHPGLGLPIHRQPVTSTPMIYLIIAVAELVLSAGTAWAIVVWWRYLGPGSVQGMASSADAEAVLGLSNLTRRRHLIRPDLSQQPK